MIAQFVLLHHKIDLLTAALLDAKRAIGSGLGWMEQVDRAKLSSATRGILHVDMGMSRNAINKINNLLINKNEITVNKESK